MRLSSAVPSLTPLRWPPGFQESQRQAALYPFSQEQTVQISIAVLPLSPNHSWRAPQRGRSMRFARRFDIQAGRGIPQDPVAACADSEPRDYHFSHYSLAFADGGVCIDMTDGQVRFDWTYVPFFETPSAFASFARRLHFRSGHHVDEPARQIRVPRRPLGRVE
jgi:hypothetical protein